MDAFKMRQFRSGAYQKNVNKLLLFFTDDEIKISGKNKYLLLHWRWIFTTVVDREVCSSEDDYLHPCRHTFSAYVEIKAKDLEFISLKWS